VLTESISIILIPVYAEVGKITIYLPWMIEYIPNYLQEIALGIQGLSVFL
jgi:hypothetical protein